MTGPAPVAPRPAIRAAGAPASRVAGWDYRCYVGAQAVFVAGTAMGYAATYWLTIHLAHGHAWVLSTLVGAQFLPVLLISRRAGNLVARHRSSRILGLAAGARAAGALAIAVPLLAGWTAVWYLCLLSLLIGCAAGFEVTARQIFMLDLVGERELRRGLSLARTVAGVARLAGPALAGAVIAAAGEGPVFLANAASFLALGAVLAALGHRAGREPALTGGEEAPTGPATGTSGGRAASTRTDRGGGPAHPFRWVLDLPRAVRPALVMAAVVGGIGIQFEVVSPLMATDVFHLGPVGFGLFGTLMASGGIAGNLYSSRRRDPGAREFLGWAAMFGVVEALAAAMPVVWAYDLALVVLGTVTALFATSTIVFVQRMSPARQRAHAVSAYNAAFMGVVPAGAFAVAGLAAVAGTRWALAGPGLVTCCAAILVAATIPHSKGARATAEAPP